MIETRGIIHFTLSVSDIDRSEAFYRDVLGLTVVNRVPALGMVFLRSGDDYVILCKSKTPIAPNPGKEIFVHHAFRIDTNAFDSTVAELRSRGVEILFEEDRQEGVFQGKQLYIHDPDRNVIELNALERVGEGHGVNGRPPRARSFTHEPPS